MDRGNRDGGHRRDRNREVGDVWRRRHGDRPSYSAVHDPTNRLLPWWLSQVGDGVIQADQTAEFTTGGSALVVDARDSRLVSPTRGWFPIVIHFEFISYRSDADMTVTRSQVNPNALRLIQDNSHEFSVQCFAFSGYKVSACSFEPGGRLYSCAPGGRVVASDVPRIHFEVRKTLRNSDDAIGTDADKVEFRYRDGREFLFECRKMQVPHSWIVASHISGQACPRICELVRTQGGRVESPDQGMQLGQLATIHERWFRDSIAEEGGNRARGDLVRTNIRVDNANVHFIVDAQLRVHQAEVVSRESLALADHDPGTAQLALFLPPRDGEGCRVVVAGPGERNLQVPVDNLVYQPPAATAKVHVVALADEGAQPRQDDGRHYVKLPIDRPSLEDKRIRLAAAEAKQRARRIHFAPEYREIDIKEILVSHAPIQAPPTFVEAAVSLEDLSADQDILIELHLDKIKAVRELEAAMQRRVQLQQVVAQSQLHYRSDEEGRRWLARATELCQLYTATIDVSRVRIDELDAAILPLAAQIELINEITEAVARSDSLEEAQFSGTLAASPADHSSTAASSSQLSDPL